jgi:hypothetical protein
MDLDLAKLKEAGMTIRAFLDLCEIDQSALLDDASRRLWKMKHKKRREYDASDRETVDALWSELVFGQFASVERTTITCTLKKPSKDWPMEMKIKAGRVKKLS